MLSSIQIYGALVNLLFVSLDFNLQIIRNANFPTTESEIFFFSPVVRLYFVDLSSSGYLYLHPSLTDLSHCFITLIDLPPNILPSRYCLVIYVLIELNDTYVKSMPFPNN